DDHPKNHAILWLEGRWRLAPMYHVVPGLEGSSPPYLSMAAGRSGRVISPENLLSHCLHFPLTPQQATDVLDEVISWEAELGAHYASHLTGAELELGVSA
ncbi:HipA domain-containing protein, partial [Pseudomonas brassicacearum]|uniref:HipA domain-containing protein n=1 Tax=Pseudomonas brassicacearum TaxID=930166 RepID=UPI0011CDC725